jgi:hypothetical protein
LVGTTDINQLTFEETGLTYTSDVQYKVRAETEAGFSAFSIRNTFIMAGQPTINSAPVKVEATSSTITVQWSFDSDGGSPILGYKLYQTNITTGGVMLVYDGSNLPTVSSTRIENLVAGHQYAYQVSALNQVGEG